MKNLKPFIFLLVSIFLLMACKGEQSGDNASLIDKCSVIATREVTEVGDTVVVCDMAKVKEKVTLPLSQLVDSLEFIRLESSEEAMVNPVAIEVTKHYVGVINTMGEYKLFTHGGKYVANIGRKGQGPGEYFDVYYSQIDELNNRIYLIPGFGSKILVYDLQGQYIQDIPLAYNFHSAIFNVNSKKELLTVIQVTWEGEDIPAVWVQDFEGNLLKSNRMRHFDGMRTFSNNIYTQRMSVGKDTTDFYLLTFAPRADTVYYYDAIANRCIPKFSLKLNEQYIHTYHETPHHYLMRLLTAYKVYPENYARSLLVDKRTLKGAQVELVMDELGGISVPLKYCLPSDYHYFAICVDPYRMMVLLEERLKEKDKMSKKDLAKVTELMNTISDDDNNYLLLGKWK